MQKLCIDCDYFRVSDLSDPKTNEHLHNCAFDSSPVNGIPVDYCTIERKYEWKCGKKGRRWKEKGSQVEEVEEECLSLWERLLGKGDK